PMSARWPSTAFSESGSPPGATIFRRTPCLTSAPVRAAAYSGACTGFGVKSRATRIVAADFVVALESSSPPQPATARVPASAQARTRRVRIAPNAIDDACVMTASLDDVRAFCRTLSQNATHMRLDVAALDAVALDPVPAFDTDVHYADGSAE